MIVRYADMWSERADRQRARLRETAIVLIRPADDERPSAWAPRRIVLKGEMGPRPGQYDIGWKPWLRALHDLEHDHPDKLGVIVLKPAQQGITRTMCNLMLHDVECDPCPILFMTTDAKQAKFWALEHFAVGLAQLEIQGVQFRDRTRKRAEDMVSYAYVGGRADFVGAGSVGKAVSRSYRKVLLDEYDTILDHWPTSAAGSPFVFAQGRMSTYRQRSWMVIVSHPRREGRGVADLIDRYADQYDWCFDCPLCGELIRPDHTCIHYTKTNAHGRVDPASAEFRCPHCEAAVNDHERCKATMRPDQGGTGRFERRPLDDDDDARAERPFIGININGLCDPHKPLRELSDKLAAAVSAADRQAVLNVDFGETYREANAVVTREGIEECVAKVKTLVVPGGPHGARILSIGVDVQKPQSNPSLYVHVGAYSPDGHEYVVMLRIFHGFDALGGFLRKLTVPLDGPGARKFLTPMVVGIDCGWQFRQVANFARTYITHAQSSRRVRIVPLRYEGYLTEEYPARMPSEPRRIDPARPELGPQERYDLSRDYWVRRKLARWAEGRVTVQCAPPSNLIDHIMANREVPKKVTHGWQDDATTFTKEKRVDDWLQAGCYSEAAAVLCCGLDSLHEHVNAPRVDKSKGQSRDSGWWPEGSVWE